MKSLSLLACALCMTSSSMAQQQQVTAWGIVDLAPGSQPPIRASSIPTLGQLFPMSPLLNVDALGNVGIGTTTPQGALEVLGQSHGASFRVVDSPGSAGTQLVSAHVSSTGQGLQARFSGPGTGYIDIGQDGGGSFVIEGNDVPRFVVAQNGKMAGGAPIYNNVQMSLGSDLEYVLYGDNQNTTSSFSTGVFGTISTIGNAVFGAGVWGQSMDPNRVAVFAEGDFRATGTKSFVQPHPTDAARQIHFVCLEGNESGTYFRGKTLVTGGTATVQVPEEFRLVSERENLTVQLTAMGNARVWLESYDLNEIVIGSTGDVEVHYMVNGVRLGYSDHQAIERNTAYVPRDERPFGTQYPKEIREMLVRNGTLNEDFTPNRDTAARLGWQLDIGPVATNAHEALARR
ncbi:hypothetical protein Poly30_44330 [Planctomycetes bacterium Poly30]|uniref:Uncharacterized protein n=1 Tax=Saltatorellus ferox TaxID=2528018 RepID=A0A518EXS0_9BACT|nr:hypothetical protein Poly30_44330 [Planctomycetes bacterium Poly30]